MSGVAEAEEEVIPRSSSDNIDVMFSAFALVIRELDGKVEHHELADGFLTVGLDMIRHMFEHALPGESPKELHERLKAHLIGVVDSLEEASEDE